MNLYPACRSEADLSARIMAEIYPPLDLPARMMAGLSAVIVAEGPAIGALLNIRHSGVMRWSFKGTQTYKGWVHN